MSNPCNVCRHRWQAERQAIERGHCYMWREEPNPCPRSAFKLDEFALQQDIAAQLLEKRAVPSGGAAHGND